MYGCKCGGLCVAFIACRADLVPPSPEACTTPLPAPAGRAGLMFSATSQSAPPAVLQNASAAVPARSSTLTRRGSTPEGAAGMSQDLVITHSCQLQAPPKPIIGHQHEAVCRGSHVAAVAVPIQPRQRTAGDSGRAPVGVAERNRQDARAATGPVSRTAPFPHTLNAMRALGMIAASHAPPVLNAPREQPPPAAPPSQKSRWQKARGAVVRALPACSHPMQGPVLGTLISTLNMTHCFTVPGYAGVPDLRHNM